MNYREIIKDLLIIIGLLVILITPFFLIDTETALLILLGILFLGLIGGGIIIEKSIKRQTIKGDEETREQPRNNLQEITVVLIILLPVFAFTILFWGFEYIFLLLIYIVPVLIVANYYYCIKCLRRQTYKNVILVLLIFIIIIPSILSPPPCPLNNHDFEGAAALLNYENSKSLLEVNVYNVLICGSNKMKMVECINTHKIYKLRLKSFYSDVNSYNARYKVVCEEKYSKSFCQKDIKSI